ncbi:MAG TPA: nucleoid-associated protein [Prosthecobacter sp.]|nr:nucleoid-associated protein [Prosthecobacter sp.]HRK16062.1 nucleoid-associated protein [Prosthecobacter sp.]
MPVKLRLNTATATRIVLAKVGNPQRQEPLQTSRQVFDIAEADQEVLTALFLKPFKNLIAHRFVHHASLDHHEMHRCSRALFADPSRMLETGVEIARRLHAKSNHPNIKSGDLCIVFIKEIHIEGELVNGLCILKSESVVPFLSITTQDGDLHLSTQQGIQPEKIDKGCLILDYQGAKGGYVLTFDRSGEDTKFWVREFLGVEAVPDSAFLTNAYAKMAVSFIEEHKPAGDTPPWDTCNAAREALAYFEEREQFDLGEFEQEVLKSPDAVAAFEDHRARVVEEQGQPLDTRFEISKKDITKAKRRIGAVLKLDTGVEIHVKSTLSTEHDPVLERGYDDAKGMKFVKVYYKEQLTAG